VMIKLPFDHHVKLGQTFTFKDLINSMYQIKSHKFDYWYELFCGVNQVNTSSTTIKININFDHGS